MSARNFPVEKKTDRERSIVLKAGGEGGTATQRIVGKVVSEKPKNKTKNKKKRRAHRKNSRINIKLFNILHIYPFSPKSNLRKFSKVESAPPPHPTPSTRITCIMLAM